jgi:hypothetical protein
MFMLSYLSFGIPVVIAGAGIPSIGLHATVSAHGT